MKKNGLKQRVLVGATAVLLTASLCLTSCGNSAEEPSQETTTTVASTTSTTKATTTTTKATTTTTTKATTTTTKATTAATTAATQAPTTVATQPVTDNGGEAIGEGSKDQPYLETPLGDMTVTTVSIPAGSSRFYNIYRVGGMVLTIYDSSAYVVCDGVRYDANGGVVSFTVPSALASDAVSFEIGNSGSSASVFTLSFSNQKGSYMDPVAVSTLEDNKSVSLPKDSEAGYYYKYIASQNGKIRFYLTASVDSMMLVTNNRNSAQRTTAADGVTAADGKIYVELEVQAGDEILINVGAVPNKRGKYPAADITWFGQYV